MKTQYTLVPFHCVVRAGVSCSLHVRLAVSTATDAIPDQLAESCTQHTPMQCECSSIEAVLALLCSAAADRNAEQVENRAENAACLRHMPVKHCLLIQNEPA